MYHVGLWEYYSKQQQKINPTGYLHILDSYITRFKELQFYNFSNTTC